MTADPPAGASLAGLRAAAMGCTGCELHEHATQTVFSIGSASARIAFVGEQPGDVEDREGKPFVGPAGRLLDQALADAGIARGTAYVTNAVKHFRERRKVVAGPRLSGHSLPRHPAAEGRPPQRAGRVAGRLDDGDDPSLRRVAC